MLANKDVYSWGDNTAGALGTQVAVGGRSSPVLVVGNHSFTQVAAGMFNSLALKADGSAWTWGQGTSGSLGDNTTTSKSSPVAVVGAHTFIFIGIGGNNSAGNPASCYALKADGSAWAWGSNIATVGQLGDQTATNRSSPVLVVGNHSFVEIQGNVGFSGGVAHVIARKVDGSVWTWGYNGTGQLGDNTTVAKSSPVLVVGSHSFKQIAAGATSSYGLKADGSVWSWGANANAELGDNSLSDRLSPVAVVGNHSFIQIAGGGYMALGLKADGSVWAWGRGTFGGLGDNTITGKSSPVLVVGAHSFVAISRGYGYSLALKNTGELWGWGNNTAGQLGDNTLANKSSPVLVVGSMNFAAFTGGDNHSLAIYGLPDTGPGRFFSAF